MGDDMDTKAQGLEGIIAGETAICTVGEDGKSLHYRGFDVTDLAQKGSFEETAYLLLYKKLPTQQEMNAFKKRLMSERSLPVKLAEVLEILPKQSHPMDVLRSSCSVLGSLEPETTENGAYAITERLLSLFPSALCYWYHFHFNGKKINTQTDAPDIASHFLKLLHGNVEPLQHKAVNVSLILYAEHSFNASTFTARVCAATLPDFYSPITAAISTLSGPLHGGANEHAFDLITLYQSPDAAEAGIKQKLKNKEKIMGFGHRVYKTHDPRSDFAKQLSRELADEAGNKIMYPVAERIEQVMWNEKKLFPNVDFYTACVYHFCGIPKFLFTPLFVFARTSGWAAHIMEQREHNRLIRPDADYIGPSPLSYIAMEKR